MRRGFTLVELLTTIAIVAMLVTGAVFFVGSYIQWAKQTSDQKTLVVLNDALTRYKCEGGNLNALTVGAPIDHVLTALQTALTWGGAGGISHQFLQKGVTYPARSLYAIGTGSQYHFTAYNTYTNEQGGLRGGGPAFGGEIQRGSHSAGAVNTTSITLASAVHAGDTLVICTFSSAQDGPASVTDTRGNSWQALSEIGGTSQAAGICWAYVSTPLQAGDTITITWNDTIFCTKSYVVYYLTGCASAGQPNVTFSAAGWATSVSASATTTANQTLCIGILGASGLQTYSGGNWTQLGAPLVAATRNAVIVYKIAASPGAQNPGGTWSAANNQTNAWIGLK